ncbi:MAG: transglutaminase N-terminal domain-containing protein, partial [Rhodospirillales bacterium]
MTEQIILTADHITTYQYEWPVSWASHVGHLAPRNTGRQTVLESQILIDPTPTWISRTVDYFGNNVVRFSLEDHHESLTVTATMAVQVGITETPDPLSTSSWSEISRTIVSPVSEIQ